MEGVNGMANFFLLERLRRRRRYHIATRMRAPPADAMAIPAISRVERVIPGRWVGLVCAEGVAQGV